MRRTRSWMRVGWLLVVVLGVGCAGEPSERAPRAQALRSAGRGAVAVHLEALLSNDASRPLGRPLHEREALRRFYRARAWRAAWDAAGREAPRELLRAVRDARSHGLSPERYHARALAEALASEVAASAGLGAERRAERDVLLSDAFLHLARQLSAGAVDPQRLHPGYARGDAPPDPVDALREALERGGVAGRLEALAPPHPEYAELRRALARRLEAADAPATDAAAADAARAAARVRLDLERWRWQPRSFGARYLLVDVPAYHLEARADGVTRLAMPVVVGSPGWTTPPLHSAIGHLVLNPAWDVPRSIAVKEMLPRQQRDPRYLEGQGLEVLEPAPGGAWRRVDPADVAWSELGADHFPLRLRQPPGPANPLGRLKFVFPSPYGVYLHGTPSRGSLARPLRALSHGCVRVEDELTLAAWALQPDAAWSRKALLARLAEDRQQGVSSRIVLPEPLPVHVVYFTSAVDADGRLVLREDPYAWNARLEAALDADEAAETAGG